MSFECVLLPESQTASWLNNSEEEITDKIPENYTGGVLSKGSARKLIRNRCCVPGCSSKDNVKSISFFKLPSAKKLNKLWKIKCRLVDKIPSTYSVCSNHFLTSDFAGDCLYVRRKKLLKNAVPSQNLPVDPYARRKNVVQIENRAQRLSNRNAKQATLPERVPCDENSNSTKCETKLQSNKVQTYSKSTNSEPPITSTGKPRKATTNTKNFVKPPIVATRQPEHTTATHNGNFVKMEKVRENASSPRVNMMDFLNLKSRAKLNAWTGIQTFSLLHKIEERVSLLQPKLSVESDLSMLESILLCFIKLKTKLSFICLTSIFHHSSESTAKIFHTMLPFLRNAMDDVDYFSSTIQSEDKQLIPLRMYGYNEARAIVDCADENVPLLKCKIEQSS